MTSVMHSDDSYYCNTEITSATHSNILQIHTGFIICMQSY